MAKNHIIDGLACILLTQKKVIMSTRSPYMRFILLLLQIIVKVQNTIQILFQFIPSSQQDLCLEETFFGLALFYYLVSLHICHEIFNFSFQSLSTMSIMDR